VMRGGKVRKTNQQQRRVYPPTQNKNPQRRKGDTWGQVLEGLICDPWGQKGGGGAEKEESYSGSH